MWFSNDLIKGGRLQAGVAVLRWGRAKGRLEVHDSWVQNIAFERLTEVTLWRTWSDEEGLTVGWPLSTLVAAKEPFTECDPLQLTPCHPFFASNPGFISPGYSVLALLDLLASYKKLYLPQRREPSSENHINLDLISLGCAEELLWKLSWKGSLLGIQG